MYNGGSLSREESMSRGERCAVCGVAQRACRATPTGQVHFRDFVVRALCEASSLVSRTRRCRSPRGAEIRRRAAHFAQNSTQESVELGISAPVKSFYRGFCAVNESRRRRRFTGGTKRSRNAPRADLMIGCLDPFVARLAARVCLQLLFRYSRNPCARDGVRIIGTLPSCCASTVSGQG